LDIYVVRKLVIYLCEATRYVDGNSVNLAIRNTNPLLFLMVSEISFIQELPQEDSDASDLSNNIQWNHGKHGFCSPNVSIELADQRNPENEIDDHQDNIEEDIEYQSICGVCVERVVQARLECLHQDLEAVFDIRVLSHIYFEGLWQIENIQFVVLLVCSGGQIDEIDRGQVIKWYSGVVVVFDVEGQQESEIFKVSC